MPTALSRKLVRFGAFVLAGITVWGTISAAGDLPLATSKEHRCPVCGMNPANYPKWRTRVVFKDGTVTALDSPAETFRFLGNQGKYDSRHTAADIVRIEATDHAKRSWIDARRASYVSGSSARGPMGADLPAFENKADAEFFARTAGGRVLNFDQAAKEISIAPPR